MLMTAQHSTLVLVDFQRNLMPAIHHGDQVLRQAVRLAEIANHLEVPVIGTEQIPDKLGRSAEELSSLYQHTLIKHHFGACQAGLVEALPNKRKDLILAGCEAHVCLLQTALGLLGAGYRVWVVEDAVGSRQESDRKAAVKRLRQNGAQIVTVEMVAFEWLESAQHPRFREVLKLIK